MPDLPIVIYGIPNCDQCRKAKAWLTAHQLPFTFHDLRAHGLTADHLNGWFKHLPWDSLLNRRGLTWRTLTDTQKASVVDQQAASELMLEHPTLVKRPVLTQGDVVMVGFNPAVWQSLVSSEAPKK
jgi:arsenate reductase (glutaredoxin)